MKKIWIKATKYWKFIVIYALIILLLNLLAQWESFCDFYTDYIFGLWSDTYSRLTGLFPFSVGEVFIVLAIFTVLVALILLVLLPLFHKKEKFYRVFAVYMKGWLVFLLSVLFIMTLNCTILYHCSRLSVNGNGEKTYTVKELEILRNYIVAQCNERHQQMERDENSNVVYHGDADAAIKSAMHSLASEYPRLSGYYPDIKRMWGSYFMYQSGYTGVYFPFSMEANCNKYINDLFYGKTACHEFSHLKGYIYEDEAEFISYLACASSGDVWLQYSGYIGVLDYVDGDYSDSVDEDTYLAQPRIDEQVYLDNTCYNEDVIKEVSEQSSFISDEAIEAYSEGFTEAYLDYYGAEANYSEVTLLLLQYYDGILY